MNKNPRASDAAVWTVIEEDAKTVAKSALSAFVVLPMPGVSGNFCQPSTATQHALYLLAFQQAEAVLRAVHRRHRLLFARGIHLWN